MLDTPEDVSICVKLTARDVRRATLLYLISPRFLAFVAVIVCVSFLNTLMNGGYVQLYVVLLPLLFVFAGLPWIQAAISMRNPTMKFPFCHTFSPLGISTKFQGGSISLEWSNIKRAAESERYIAIWGKRGAPLLIPKIQLREDHLSPLRTVLKLNLHDKAKLRP